MPDSPPELPPEVSLTDSQTLELISSMKSMSVVDLVNIISIASTYGLLRTESSSHICLPVLFHKVKAITFSFLEAHDLISDSYVLDSSLAVVKHLGSPHQKEGGL